MMDVVAGQLIMSEMLTRRRVLINGGLTGIVLAGSRFEALTLQEDLFRLKAEATGFLLECGIPLLGIGSFRL